MNLLIRPAEREDIREVRHWVAIDPPQNFNLSEGVEFGKVDGWVALDGDELVAYASVSDEPGRGARIGFIVKPSRRREGIAKTFVPMLLESEHLNQFNHITGTSALGDTAAKKVLLSSGFREAGYDENGHILFERR